MRHPPIDNVWLRRAILPAIDQSDSMVAARGEENELYGTGVSVFTPGSPLANTAGLEVLTGPRDLDRAKRLVAESGCKGERIVFLAPTDYPILYAYCQVGSDLLRRLGLNVDFQAPDWGTMINRRNNRDTVGKGGWSAFCTSWEGLNLADPGAHAPIGGQGDRGWFGWYASHAMEDLRSAWFDAHDLAAQRAVAEQIQRLTWEEAPFYPLGQAFQPLARRTNIEGIVKSPFPLFWNFSKTADAGRHLPSAPAQQRPVGPGVVRNPSVARIRATAPSWSPKPRSRSPSSSVFRRRRSTTSPTVPASRSWDAW